MKVGEKEIFEEGFKVSTREKGLGFGNVFLDEIKEAETLDQADRVQRD